MAARHVRNVHTWRAPTSEHPRRDLRARLFGKRWSLAERLGRGEDWTPVDEPTVENLQDLHRVLLNKYRRKHLAWDHLASVEELLRARGAEPEPGAG